MKRNIFILLTLLIIVPAACSIAVSFTPDGDDGAMANIENSWVDTSTGLRLTLCEDRALADKTEPEGCSVQHIIKGGGRGKEESPVRGGNNCKDCQWDSMALVKGTVEGGPFTAPAAVSGIVLTKDYNLPYALPYQVELHCTGAGGSCDIAGTITMDGISLRVTRPAGGSPSAEQKLVLEKKSVCAP